MIHLERDGQITRTRFKSLTSVRRWATKYGHAWENKGHRDVIVSCADGSILRYRQVLPNERKSNG